MGDTQTLENLTVAQAEKASGMSQAWWRMMIWKRKVAYHKIGAAVRIPRAEIERILRESLVPVKEGR